jgi:hypothetical protein
MKKSYALIVLSVVTFSIPAAIAGPSAANHTGENSMAETDATAIKCGATQAKVVAPRPEPARPASGAGTAL